MQEYQLEETMGMSLFIALNRIREELDARRHRYRRPPGEAGLIAQRQFGGTAKWRTCFAADGTGHVLQYAMDSVVVKLGVTVHDRCEAISLIHDGETCSAP